MNEEGNSPYPAIPSVQYYQGTYGYPVATQGSISMPQEALTSFFDAQYRMVELMVGVRKLDLSHLCFSLNFLFSYVFRNFLLCFPY